MIDPPANNPRQLTLRLSLDDEATFANFYCPAAAEQSANAAVVAYLQQCAGHWAQRQSGDEGGTLLKAFVWLWGGAGAGCSHLLQAVCHELDARGQAVFYLSLSGWREMTPDVLSGLEQVAVLCLDDIDEVAGHPEWEEALFHLYNRMAALQTPLLLAARSSPQYTGFTLKDLHSRLQSAAVFQLAVLDDENKMAALQMRASHLGFELSEEVAGYLVRRCERSMSALMAMLHELDRHSLELQRKITVPLIKSLMNW
ncbi:MAG: DnaA regulatory inactivator Hda [Pseudohongiella sp.]|uniref:DnaA regulatory inactivator Hda n=1 Tax=Pseudohongiella sp. TaxID=1979412 RepID=UPI0034A03DBE